MGNDGQTENQLQDIVELDDARFSIAEIEKLAKDDFVIKEYESKFKDNLYSTILLSLTHEHFSEQRAKKLWSNIINHMFLLNSVLGRDVGVSVATLDYLTNVTTNLQEPTIIEEDKSSYIADATTRDELTGLYLRDVFDVVLNKEIDEANRSKQHFCLLMMDIDNFKNINDTYGHIVGDEVLAKIGRTINDLIREMDTAARYGGEELIAVLPKTGIKQACVIAERIRETIEKLKFNDFSLTISIGVSHYGGNLKTEKELIDAADKALYKAKNSGKNQVILFDEHA